VAEADSPAMLSHRESSERVRKHDIMASKQVITKRRDRTVVVQSTYSITVSELRKAHPGPPIPVAERSKARFCGRSLAGIVGSNPVPGAWMFVLCVLVR
jgi:hypothetical protein